MKTCSKCKEAKPATAEFFYKARDAKDVLCTQCKDCRSKDYKSKYHLYAESKKRYRHTNKEVIKAKRDVWRKKPENSERIKGQDKKWRASNTERVKVIRKRYIENNQDTIKSYNAKFKIEKPLWHNWYGLKRRCGINTPNYNDFHQHIKQFIKEDNTVDCPYCKQSFSLLEISIDHIIPLFMGGDDSLQNLTLCCLPCNVKKGRKLMSNANLI